jgi:2-phospho-L-lactate guanylyltransferase (CobY/MobA/RfbA family)
MPFAFTEQGVAMLSSVLKSAAAIEVNISIMRAFVSLRQLVLNSADIQKLTQENSEIRRALEEFIEETEGKFDDVYVALSEMALQRQERTDKPRNPIGYKQ